MPTHRQEEPTIERLEELKNGPGKYDMNYGQIERRNDLGIVEFKINDNNSRQKEIDRHTIKRDIFDGWL